MDQKILEVTLFFESAGGFNRTFGVGDPVQVRGRNLPNLSVESIEADVEKREVHIRMSNGEVFEYYGHPIFVLRERSADNIPEGMEKRIGDYAKEFFAEDVENAKKGVPTGSPLPTMPTPEKLPVNDVPAGVQATPETPKVTDEAPVAEVTPEVAEAASLPSERADIPQPERE